MMSNACIVQVTNSAQQLARELFERLRRESVEAEQLALQMIAAGEARLRFSMVLAGDQPGFALLLEPVKQEGVPVELAASNPMAPSVEGLAGRFWFFGRLSHWQHFQH
jgi:hypothetical protein